MALPRESLPRDRLAVALDSELDLAQVAKVLGREVGYLKIGLWLFTRRGPEAVRLLLREGARIFLDLKLHDIPNTVEQAAREAGALGVELLTVHASGGPAMVKAAAKGAAEGAASVGARPPAVLAVTVLTSLNDDDLLAIGLQGPAAKAVERLAMLSVKAGAAGIVCSAREVAALRTLLGPGPLLVTPGIRPAGEAAQDQARTATPVEAIRAGADLLVVGRPILGAPDPAKKARELVAEIATALPASNSQ